MKTKIVYVVASLNSDVYMEQAIVSAWSAKHHNPNCFITMVCDQDTFETTKSGVRNKYKSLFDEIVVKGFDASQGMMERSRWMKTSLRSIVDGDFLYLDTDTVVCGDLSYVDDFEFDLGFVSDNNCLFDKYIIRKDVIKEVEKVFGIDVSSEKHYFNSGAAFVRDVENNDLFYETWHRLWKYSKDECQIMKDQKALMVANIHLGYPVREMTGNLNCQAVASVQFLYTADVLHFYNCFMGKADSVSPFIDNSIYGVVKKDGISLAIIDKVLNCKSSFSSPSMLVSLDGAIAVRTFMKYGANGDVLESKSFHLLLYIYNKQRFLFAFVEKILRACLRVYLVLHR